MKSKTLKNGLKIIYDQIKSDSVSIVVTIKTGSIHEHPKKLGIAHFLEHMIFEGTNKRKDANQIANEIEALGGELNAYTTTDRTVFFVRVLNRNFLQALDVLSDITQNSIFPEKSVEKERDVILKEINMVTDDPRFYQWTLFYQALFKKHPGKNAVYGTIDTVKAITRQDIIDFYTNHYTANNTIISVVGNANNALEKVEDKFKDYRKNRTKKPIINNEPSKVKVSKKVEKRKILNSYIVYGYHTPKREHKDSYTLDVIRSILSRGQSGRIVEEIRNKRGLAYDVSAYHDSGIDFGIFAVYLNTEKKNIGLALNIIKDQIKKLNNIDEKELKIAKGYLLGQYLLNNEDTYHKADSLGFFTAIKDPKLAKQFESNIKKVSISDIKNATKKYLHKNYALSIIEQL